jgi:hypothetical protein
MLSAEKKCKKPPAPPYSKKLAALDKIIQFWKIIKSNITTGRNVENIIMSIKETIPKPMQHLLIKTQAVNSHIRKAVDNYRQAVPNAMELRQEQIREWAKAAAQQGKKNNGSSLQGDGKCRTHKAHIQVTTNSNQATGSQRYHQAQGAYNRWKRKSTARQRQQRTMARTYGSERN